MADAKTQKYDRQLRLWQAHGQARLEKANICLINGNAVGTEIMKNLVLPAIGSFTVVDPCKVTERDLGSNFFVTVNDIGKSRAQVTMELLRELNEEVSGAAVEDSVSNLLKNNPSFFVQFTLVIATQLAQPDLLALGEYCWAKNIPFIAVRLCGFWGLSRSVVREHCVIESHPESPTPDLRLSAPFPSLLQLLTTVDFSAADSLTFSHIPFVLILLHCIQQFKATHGGAIPSTSEERSEFRKMVAEMRREDVAEQQNINEAEASVYRAWAPVDIPSNIQDIMDDRAADLDQLSKDSEPFWIYVHALRTFARNHNCLPLAGSLPDMHSDTDSYVRLQTVYHDKSMRDYEEILQNVKQLWEKLRRTDSVDPDEVKRFCRNARWLKISRGKSIEEEYADGTALRSALSDPTSPSRLYLLFRAMDAFHQRYGRYPGSSDDNDELDAENLMAVLKELLHSVGLEPRADFDDMVREGVRAGGSELHSVAAFVGGIVSQECLKVITKQYGLVHGGFVVDAVKAVVGEYKV
ncbi:NEDD8-activating enzyme E1 regulatory subunit [Gaertneriomyces sp. JEL0708]|nr:NEDD8-activating enzyme E1 regulatory subunit [Gaertneriomyces sp. JEL0708]